MREVDPTNEKRTTDIYRIIRLTLLILALIFLVTAAFIEGKEYIGAKIVLIVIGACLLSAGVTTYLLKRAPEKQ